MPETTSVETEDNPQQLILKAIESAPKMTSMILDASIFRLSSFLDEGDYEKYCKPKCAAIGPFHTRAGLLVLGGTKLMSIAIFTNLLGDEEVMKTLITELEESEPAARACYGLDKEVTNMKSNKFLRIMIAEGCQLFLPMAVFTLQNRIPILGRTVIGGSSPDYLDFIKLENQIPFFILESIYQKFEQQLLQLHPVVAASRDSSFSGLALSYLKMVLLKWYPLCTPKPEQRIKHLLHLAKIALFPPRRPPLASTSLSHDKLTETRSASQLKAHGVKFRMPENANFLPDLHFQNGVLEIPKLVYNEITAGLLMNFFVYEVLYQALEETDVTSYVCFMDSLIRDETDVKVLIQSGVLQARITDAKEIVSLFNSLARFLMIKPKMYHYEHLHRQLKEYCESGPRPLCAKLVDFYHHGRWDFLNTVLLSILTLTQTLFSILQFFIPSKK